VGQLPVINPIAESCCYPKGDENGEKTTIPEEHSEAVNSNIEKLCKGRRRTSKSGDNDQIVDRKKHISAHLIG